MRERLLTMKNAAAKLGMSVSVFCARYEEMELYPVRLTIGTHNKRWPESEIDTYIAGRINARDTAIEEERKTERQILQLVRRRKTG